MDAPVPISYLMKRVLADKEAREKFMRQIIDENYFDMSVDIKDQSDIKYFIQFIKDDANRMTSANYMHKRDGILNAIEEIEKILIK